MSDDKMLLNQCLSIKETLESEDVTYICDDCGDEHLEDEVLDECGNMGKCPSCDSENLREFSAYDYLEDVLDINYIVGSSGSYKGAKILVCFGGPNIWVDTDEGLIKGYWWGESVRISFYDRIGLDDALEELYACVRG